MFCRNCGKEVPAQAVMCISCGCQPWAGNVYCPGCGAPTQPNAVLCIKCGSSLSKSQTLDTSTKPGLIQAIGILRLVSGILNCLTGLLLCWLILPMLLIPLGIVEIVSAANLMKDRPKAPSGMKAIAILEIVAIISLMWTSLVVGILTLVWLSKNEVKAYLASLKP